MPTRRYTLPDPGDPVPGRVRRLLAEQQPGEAPWRYTDAELAAVAARLDAVAGETRAVVVLAEVLASRRMTAEDRDITIARLTVQVGRLEADLAVAREAARRFDELRCIAAASSARYGRREGALVGSARAALEAIRDGRADEAAGVLIRALERADR